MNSTTVLVATFALPYPPSVNDYWQPVALAARKGRRAPARIVRTGKGDKYRRDVAETCLRLRLEGELSEAPILRALEVRVEAYPPVRTRRRDLDNLWKALLDALVYAGVVLDDSQFIEARIRWGEPRKTPHVRVAIGRPALAPEETESFLGVDRPREPLPRGPAPREAEQIEAFETET